jgi:hypothetical protein
MTKIIVLVAVLVASGAAHARAPRHGGVIVSQTSGITGYSFSSQSQFGTAAADAFTIRNNATVQTVVANGIYFNGSGPPTSESVIFYTDKKAKPGKPIKNCTYPNVKGADNDGSLTIKLPKACKLKQGIYWLSVVVDVEIGVDWNWLNAAETGPYQQADWQNPGGTTCVTWTPLHVCAAGNFPNGFAYELLGKGS